MRHSKTENQSVDEVHTDSEFCPKELELLENEWKETRVSIGRFDAISVDLRKYGFTLITFMITASAVAFEATNLKGPLPVLIVPFSIMILIAGLFLTDRYYEVLLLGAVLRSRQLEDTSHEILSTYIKSTVYLRLNLTTFLEDKVQQNRARFFSFVVYLLFMIACLLLGIFSLITYYQQVGKPLSMRYLVMLGIFGLVAMIFLFIVNHTVTNLIKRIQSEIIIDDRIVIRKLFKEDEISDAIKRLAREVHTAFSQNTFKILTIGIGGLHFAKRLIGELKKVGRTNIESISVFSEKIKKDQSIYEVKIKAPKKHLLQGENILIVDDLVATGFTLQELTKICEDNGANVQACILLDASNLRKADKIQINFKGLRTEETGSFVGCGMDIYSECRELPYIGIVRSYKPKKA